MARALVEGFDAEQGAEAVAAEDEVVVDLRILVCVKGGDFGRPVVNFDDIAAIVGAAEGPVGDTVDRRSLQAQQAVRGIADVVGVLERPHLQALRPGIGNVVPQMRRGYPVQRPARLVGVGRLECPVGLARGAAAGVGKLSVAKAVVGFPEAQPKTDPVELITELGLDRFVFVELVLVDIAAVDARQVHRIGEIAIARFGRVPKRDCRARPVERTRFELNPGVAPRPALGRDGDDAGCAVGAVQDRLRPAQNLHALDRGRIDLAEQVVDAAGTGLVDLHAIDDDENGAARETAHLRVVEMPGPAGLLEFEAGLAAHDLGEVGITLELDLVLADDRHRLRQIGQRLFELGRADNDFFHVLADTALSQGDAPDAEQDRGQPTDMSGILAGTHGCFTPW